MNNHARQLSQSHEILGKVAQVLQTRTRIALERYRERLQRAFAQQTDTWKADPQWPWMTGAAYMVDFAQRSLLFWDTLRQRGNNFIEHERQGLPPVLRFEHEMVMDGRTLERRSTTRCCASCLPRASTVDPRRRPVRGHRSARRTRPRHRRVQGRLAGRRGPSRGSSSVLRHVFPRIPSRGRRCSMCVTPSAQFVHRVRELHPDAAKPALVGNCQAGWAAMMLASASPEDIGPVVVVGAPMSYWGGAWREGEGDNPMRYAGGLLGGTWLASLTSDLGAGKFDGAEPGAELREPQPCQYVLGQVLPGVRQRGYASRSASSSSSGGGAATSCSIARRSSGSRRTSSSATGCGPVR